MGIELKDEEYADVRKAVAETQERIAAEDTPEALALRRKASRRAKALTLAYVLRKQVEWSEARLKAAHARKKACEEDLAKAQHKLAAHLADMKEAECTRDS
jgi:hypothetical protein